MTQQQRWLASTVLHVAQQQRWLRQLSEFRLLMYSTAMTMVASLIVISRNLDLTTL